MAHSLSADEIQNLGFVWPKHILIEQHCVIEEGKVDPGRTIQELQSSRIYYKRQLDEAFAFKARFGADYSDFTNRFDEYAQMYRELDEAISYSEGIVEAAERQGTD